MSELRNSILSILLEKYARDVDPLITSFDLLQKLKESGNSMDTMKLSEKLSEIIRQLDEEQLVLWHPLENNGKFYGFSVEMTRKGRNMVIHNRSSFIN